MLGSPGLVGSSLLTLKPLMAEELSLKAITELLSGFALRVSPTMSNRHSSTGLPSTVSSPLKNQCRLCSELDWPKSKSSTFVGFLPISSRKSLT